MSALGAVNRGATLILAEKFSASRFFQHLRDHGATIATGNPTTINILLNSGQTAHRDDLPSLRFITSSSAPLTLGDWKRFEQKFGIPVSQGCGTSEVGWIAACPGEQRRLGTVGRPFAYLDLAIVDADGARLPPGEIGYVELGGWPDLAFRYLGEDGEIKVHSRGRYRTGDLGSLDADGFLMLTGREKEQIIRGGAKISPVEIDSYLMQRADVIEAATVGVPDPIYGEEVVSYVVTRPGARGRCRRIVALLRRCAAGLQGAEAHRARRRAAEDRTRQARPQGAGGEVEAGSGLGRTHYCVLIQVPRPGVPGGPQRPRIGQTQISPGRVVFGLNCAISSFTKSTDIVNLAVTRAWSPWLSAFVTSTRSNCVVAKFMALRTDMRGGGADELRDARFHVGLARRRQLRFGQQRLKDLGQRRAAALLMAASSSAATAVSSTTVVSSDKANREPAAHSTTDRTTIPTKRYLLAIIVSSPFRHAGQH